MAESTRQVQSGDPYDRFEEAINDSRFYERYRLQRQAEPQDLDAPAHDRLPIFRAGQHLHDQHAVEYSLGQRNKGARGSRIVTSLFALSAVTAILALVSVDSTRAVIGNAKAPLTSGVASAAARTVQPDVPASASPSRDEIAAAYQTAIKARVVAAEPATREAPPPKRHIDANELSRLLKRAKGLFAIGDVTAARLLLEWAADAETAEAALMLAETYDPEVLERQDMRSIVPDPAMARLWYQKAAQFGSPDARQHLSQNQN